MHTTSARYVMCCLVNSVHDGGVFFHLQVTDDPDEHVKSLKISTPTFASFGDESYYVFVDGVVILGPISTFIKTMLLWFAVHYVLNIQYAKPVNEVCLFLQEYIFDQAHKIKKTASYLASCTDILKHLSFH